MTRRFVVTAIAGDIDVTSFCDPGPQYAGVMVSASNSAGESITFRRSLDTQPHVGDVIEFNELPESATATKDIG